MIKKGLTDLGFCIEDYLRFYIKNFILLKHTHNLKLFDKVTDSTTAKNTF